MSLNELKMFVFVDFVSKNLKSLKKMRVVAKCYWKWSQFCFENNLLGVKII